MLTGAGVSADSGIKTFRDHGGLWEGHDVMDVASIEGWHKDPEMVLNFYNMRRKNAREAKPNKAHKLIAELEKHHEVDVITQNVDNLHERAGSSNVLHLHGEMLKVRSIGNENYVVNWEEDLNLGDTCPDGHQLRPHIVWFGEAVPMIEEAARRVSKADFLLVVGTSLVVYPAAGLVNFVHPEAPKFVIDPKLPEVSHMPGVVGIEEKAGKGMEILFEKHLFIDLPYE